MIETVLSCTEMAPHSPMKDAQNATSNSGACIPTNSCSKPYMDAGGPGIARNSEDEDTSVFKDREESTTNNELTKCKDVSVKTELVKPEEDATATTEPIRNDGASAQIMKREEGATRNHGPTKGESHVTPKDIRIEDATTEDQPTKKPLGKQNKIVT